MTKFEECILELNQPQNAQQTFLDFINIFLYIYTWNHPKKSEIDTTIKKYSSIQLDKDFTKAFSILAAEMEATKESKNGYDILGRLYQKLFQTTDANCILPWEQSISLVKLPVSAPIPENHQCHFLDVGARTARLGLAKKQVTKGVTLFYHGVEYSEVLIQIGALNLFLAGFTNSEMIYVNPKTYEFIGCYKIRPTPDKNIEWTNDLEKVDGWNTYQHYLLVKKLRG